MKKIIHITIITVLLSFLGNAQIVSIPDANFEQALIDANIDSDSKINGQVLQSDLTGVTFLNIANKNISSIEGISFFNDLQTLFCENNTISDVSDLDSLTNLQQLRCNNNDITIINFENSTSLVNVNCSNNEITNINMSKSGILETLNCSNNMLTSLNMSNSPILEDLDCNSNFNMTSLFVNNNTKLLKLFCFNNDIANLNLSSNILLEDIRCSRNRLTNLDLSLNTSLINIYCDNNFLQSLNVKNGNNNFMGNNNFNATVNPNLICIEVDSESFSQSNWNNIDSQTSFSSFCKTIAIPDSNFEQALIDANIDNNGLNGNILSLEAQTYASLSLNSKNISNLTGIEAFTNITNLSCADNQISSINLSENTLLENLTIRDNMLTSLDLNKNTALTSIDCQDNDITALDISQNTLLEILNCKNNELTALNTNSNLKLLNITCSFNQITSLDFSTNSALEDLNCQANNLTSLNIKNGNNNNINTFIATVNPSLACITVDDVTYSTNNWLSIDSQTSFSTNCSTLTADTIDKFNVSLYPNPASNLVYFSTPNSIQINKIEITDVFGKIITKTLNPNRSLSVGHLSKGLYFIKLSSNEQSVIKKLLIE